MWVNLTGGEGPKTQKESLYYRGKGAYVGAGIQRAPGQRVGWANVTMVLGLPLQAVDKKREPHYLHGTYAPIVDTVKREGVPTTLSTR